MSLMGRIVERYVQRYHGSYFRTIQDGDMDVQIWNINTHIVDVNVRKSRTSDVLRFGLGTQVRVRYGQGTVDGKVGAVMRSGIELIFYNDKEKKVWEYIPYRDILFVCK